MIIYISTSNSDLLSQTKNFMANHGYFSFPQVYNQNLYISIDTETGKTGTTYSPIENNIITSYDHLISKVISLPPVTIYTSPAKTPTVVYTQPTQSAQPIKIDLTQHIISSVYSKINNISLPPSTSSLDEYSFIDYNNAIFTRNTNVWTQNVDITCISSGWYNVSGNYSGGNFRNCLVTPDIIIGTNHQPPQVGNDVLHFTDNNNNVYTTTVIARELLQLGYANDIAIARVSPALPSMIKPAKVLPSQAVLSNLYLSSTDISSQIIPIIISNQYHTLQIHMLYYIDSIATCYAYGIVSPYNQWWKELVSGDSSCPSFMLINGELVVMGAEYAQGAGLLPTLAAYIPQINAAIATMGSPYQLAQVDLSGFLQYF